jgi:hypothetical protein
MEFTTKYATQISRYCRGVAAETELLADAAKTKLLAKVEDQKSSVLKDH